MELLFNVVNMSTFKLKQSLGKIGRSFLLLLLNNKFESIS